jgi:hypothetical protein
VRELGHTGLGEYLAQRYVRERKRVEDIATECNVRVNTVRRYLKIYGFTVGTPREKLARERAGMTFICGRCKAEKYYSPAVAKKLIAAEYKCRSCKNFEVTFES